MLRMMSKASDKRHDRSYVYRIRVQHTQILTSLFNTSSIAT